MIRRATGFPEGLSEIALLAFRFSALRVTAPRLSRDDSGFTKALRLGASGLLGLSI
jgi:hypothetical protein